MKLGIHPEMVDCVVTCSCGNTFVTLSTSEAMHVDICSNCHPYFTGTQRLVDTAGQVERFNRRLEKKATVPEVTAEASAKAPAKQAAKTPTEVTAEAPADTPAEVTSEAPSKATAEATAEA